MAANTIVGPQRRGSLSWIAVGGAGLLVMLSDTDVGNVVTAAQAGSQWGYRLLPLLLLLVPMLYMLQELTVRLGIHTGRGYCELIRERFGAGWAWLATAALVAAVLGSLVTQFTGFAGIGELFGVPRGVSLTFCVGFLLVMVATGSYRRVERVLIFIGAFELAFFAVAWASHPNLPKMAFDFAHMPLGDSEFKLLAAALIGAVLAPWMIFYQQSALADKQVLPADLTACRWDTAMGAVLTQCLTGAIVVVGAEALAHSGGPMNLTNVGEISRALSPLLGQTMGRLVFSAGVLGASMLAATVCSLALKWGLSEAIGLRRSAALRSSTARFFYGIYSLCVVGAAVPVALSSNLVRLNIVTQTINVFLLPLVIGLLIRLALTALPNGLRPRGVYLGVLVGMSTLAVGAGLFGCVSWYYQRLQLRTPAPILSDRRGRPAGWRRGALPALAGPKGVR